jgi:hypothetical protein
VVEAVLVEDDFLVDLAVVLAVEAFLVEVDIFLVTEGRGLEV